MDEWERGRHERAAAYQRDVAPLIAALAHDEILVEAVNDPDAARSAMSALRRRLGNAAARPLIEPLLGHGHDHVRLAARDHLRRIDKATTEPKR